MHDPYTVIKDFKWIDERGRIPFWARWIWPKVHFCVELDGALITDPPEFCACTRREMP